MPTETRPGVRLTEPHPDAHGCGVPCGVCDHGDPIAPPEGLDLAGLRAEVAAGLACGHDVSIPECPDCQRADLVADALQRNAPRDDAAGAAS